MIDSKGNLTMISINLLFVVNESVTLMIRNFAYIISNEISNKTNAFLETILKYFITKNKQNCIQLI